MLPFIKHWLVDKKRNPTPPWSHLDSSYTHLLMSYNVPRKRVTSGLLRPKVWRPFRTKWRLLRHQMLPYAWLVQLDCNLCSNFWMYVQHGPSGHSPKDATAASVPTHGTRPFSSGAAQVGFWRGLLDFHQALRGHAREISGNQGV